MKCNSTVAHYLILIVRDTLFAGSARYDDFQRSLGIATNILTDALSAWDDRGAAPDGPPIRYAHQGCGGSVTDEVVGARCGRLPAEGGVTAAPGPGMPAERAAFMTELTTRVAGAAATES